MSKQAYADTFQEFEVHLVLSKGKFAFAVDAIKTDGKAYAITISNDALEMNYMEAFTGSLTLEEGAKMAQLFEEESAMDLEGNVFCTKEKHPMDALRELQLCLRFGVDRVGPTRTEFTAMLAQSLVTGVAPDLSNVATWEIYEFTLSLFDLDTFQNDPIAAAWVAELRQAIAAASGDTPVQVTDLAADFSLPPGAANAVRDIRVAAHGPAGSFVVQVTPASNGIFFSKL